MITPQDKDCFSLSWEEGHPECAGGVDPLHTNPRTGTHALDRCALYDECGRAFKMKEAQKKLASAAQQVIPTNDLLRQQQRIQPYAPPPPPQTRAPGPSYQTQQYAQQYTQPAQQPQQVYTRPVAPPPQPPAPPQQQQQQLALPPPMQYYPSVYSPIQTLMPHEAAPFLTNTEEKIEGVSTWKRILAESLRAGAKGVLQQGAFIVDHTPFFQGPKR